MGLAVIHPVLYRHLYESALERFARFARNVWNVPAGKDDEETARAGIRALADFIAEICLPSNFRQMGIDGTDFFKAVA